MFKVVALLSLAGLALGGSPLSYGGSVYHQPALAYAQQAPIAYAQPQIVRAAPIAHAVAPVAHAVAAVRTEAYDPHPQYNYGYSVADGLTGDQKNAQESRDGDLVQGSYSLVEPDGAIRTVRYTADDVHGFNAVVERSAPAVHQQVVKAVAPAVAVRTAYASPAYASPAYASPVLAHGAAYGHHF